MGLFGVLLLLSAACSACVLAEQIVFGEMRTGSTQLVSGGRYLKSKTSVKFNTEGKFGLTIDKVQVYSEGKADVTVTSGGAGRSGIAMVVTPLGKAGPLGMNTVVTVFGRFADARGSLVDKSHTELLKWNRT